MGRAAAGSPARRSEGSPSHRYIFFFQKKTIFLFKGKSIFLFQENPGNFLYHVAMRIHWSPWQHWVSCQMPKNNESEYDPSTVLQK